MTRAGWGPVVQFAVARYRHGMPRCFKPVALLLFLVVLAACDREAYIFTPNEFDRSRPGFGRELTDRSELQICYNNQTITPQALLGMAAKECGRFGKRAVFSHHEYLECPLMTPARAHFRCVAPPATPSR